MFRRESEILAVAWTPLNRTTDWKLPEVKAIDLTTGQELKQPLKISTAPVLLSGLPENLAATARANAGKLPPWPGAPGSYADADFVRIDYSQKIPEQGLHTRAGDAVSRAIVAYGGSARAGDAPAEEFLPLIRRFCVTTAFPSKSRQKSAGKIPGKTRASNWSMSHRRDSKPRVDGKPFPRKTNGIRFPGRSTIHDSSIIGDTTSGSNRTEYLQPVFSTEDSSHQTEVNAGAAMTLFRWA